MATLTLGKIWINRLDSGEAISAQSNDRGRSHDVDGDVRGFGTGRQRAYSVAGERGRFAFSLRDVSLSTIDLLRAWIGVDVMVRDHRGQMFTGVFFAVNIVEHKTPTLYDVAVVLRTVTVPAGV